MELQELIAGIDCRNWLQELIAETEELKKT